MLLQHILDIIESAAPLSYQESWDNSGLQVGDTNADIQAALLTTDVTESVVSEAVMLGCQLIISHHPLLFHGLKHLTGMTPQERCVALAIRHNIAIYSTHTALDCQLHGVSGGMADLLGVKDYRLLQTEDGEHGLGVIGLLPEPIPIEALIHRVQEAFGVEHLRYVPAIRSMVQCVAMCGGAGAEFMDEAVRQGADVYITADMKYHEMQAADGRIGLIDIDHWHSEQHTRLLLANMLKGSVVTYISQQDHSPVCFV